MIKVMISNLGHLQQMRQSPFFSNFTKLSLKMLLQLISYPNRQNCHCYSDSPNMKNFSVIFKCCSNHPAVTQSTTPKQKNQFPNSSPHPQINKQTHNWPPIKATKPKKLLKKKTPKIIFVNCAQNHRSFEHCHSAMLNFHLNEEAVSKSDRQLIKRNYSANIGVKVIWSTVRTLT